MARLKEELPSDLGLRKFSQLYGNAGGASEFPRRVLGNASGVVHSSTTHLARTLGFSVTIDRNKYLDIERGGGGGEHIMARVQVLHGCHLGTHTRPGAYCHVHR